MIPKSVLALMTLCLGLALPALGQPFHAGLNRTTFTDPVMQKEATLTIWYPTTAPETDFHAGPFTMQVATGAPVADGRFPLLILSHGAGGTAVAYRSLAIDLARHGYLVAGPSHPGDTRGDAGGRGTAAVWAGRPRQVTLAIDRVIGDSTYGPHIDPLRVGMMGHSAGGYTALAAAGARPDPMRIQRHCAAHPEDTGFCAFGSGQARQDVRQGRTVTVTPDPRIKAVVLMAPLGVLFSTEALHAVTVPVRLYAAEKDEVLLASYNAAHIRDSLGRPPEYVVVPNGGHFSFVTPFPASLHAEVGVVDQDPPEFNRPAFQAKLSAEIVDFFDRTLKAGG